MSGPAVVLAFSGGLDTSFCVLDLTQKGYEVHTLFADSGGVSEAERKKIEERAMSLGAASHICVDIRHALWNEVAVPLFWSHGRFLDQYPLLCSDRYLIVEACINRCRELGTRLFAHGCTGMGNDQLRFDQTARCLGDFEIIAPIRSLQVGQPDVRTHEIQVIEEAGHKVESISKTYTINANFLGVTISGSEIDAYEHPAEESRVLCQHRRDWPEEPLSLQVTFRRGEAVALDGRELDGANLLETLNKRLGDYGVGWHIYTGDVNVGIKGRIAFECPGIDGISAAHRALQDCTNTRFQNGFRHIVAARWAELVYSGFFFDPHRQDLEAYLRSSQRSANGTVEITTHGGSVLATAVESEYRLQEPGSLYAQSATWTPEEAVGFIKLLGKSTALWRRVNREVRHD